MTKKNQIQQISSIGIHSVSFISATGKYMYAGRLVAYQHHDLPSSISFVLFREYDQHKYYLLEGGLHWNKHLH